jgi:apolipoprotein N-acyltransferase
MASRPDRSLLLAALAAIALSAACWWFGSGVHPLWWVTWLAPLPILWLAPRLRALWAAIAAFVAFAIGGCNQWTYLHGYIGLPMSFILEAIGGPALVMTLAVLLYRRLLARGHMMAATLAPATLWVAVEYVNSLLSPHGTFGSIAYSQMDALPVIQIAALTGLWGVSFLLFLLPAALAVQAWPGAKSRRWHPAALAVALVPLAATLAYGLLRLQAPAETTLRIGLVSLEKPVRPALHSAEGQTLEARYTQAIDALAQQGARIVVTPETSFATHAATVPTFVRLAQRHDLVLDVGIDDKGDPSAEHNMAMVFQPDVTAPVTYDKHHLIPGFERQYTPGLSYRMLRGTPRIGLAICKDMDFHDIGFAYAARNAQLLLVPAWDFRIDGWLHSRMAIMRGVENGFAIARVARSGRLTLSDDRGRVVAETSSEHHDAELVGDLPLRQTHTLYGRWGDWFCWMDVAALVVLLGLAWGRMPWKPDSG